MRYNRWKNIPILDVQINVYGKLHNCELSIQFRRPNMVRELTKKKKKTDMDGSGI